MSDAFPASIPLQIAPCNPPVVVLRRPSSKISLRMRKVGVKPQTLIHVEYDIEAWARFLGKPIILPRFKQTARAEPWVPTDEHVQRIKETASNYRAIVSRNRCIIDVLFAAGLKIGD